MLRSVTAALLFFSSTSFGATIAVIDSGVDVDHRELQRYVWVNPIDSTFDLFDDDGNGKPDDVYGWNFIDKNNVLIDLTQTALLTPDVKTFFLLQGKVLTGEATEEQKKWLRKKIADTSFRSRVTQYGAFAHGTHVAGIAATESVDNKVFTVRLIPTKNPLQGIVDQVNQAVAEGKKPNWIVKNIIKAGFFVLAKVQGQVFSPIGSYLAEKEIDVANGSFGIGVPQARTFVYPVLKLISGASEPNSETVDEIATFFVNQVLKSQISLVRNAPNTLFVFAAGNDAINSDQYPVAPANIKEPNTISVAATTPTATLASFSNYGTVVDIAAPGVAIESTTPRGPNLPLSGTSQAAPKVAGVAAGIKALNPELSPQEIKNVLLQTADRKATLQGKVASGLLNARRAFYAAQVSRNTSLDAAIEQARTAVQDGYFPASSSEDFGAQDYIDVMPSPLF